MSGINGQPRRTQNTLGKSNPEIILCFPRLVDHWTTIVLVARVLLLQLNSSIFGVYQAESVLVLALQWDCAYQDGSTVRAADEKHTGCEVSLESS